MCLETEGSWSPLLLPHNLIPRHILVSTNDTLSAKCSRVPTPVYHHPSSQPSPTTSTTTATMAPVTHITSGAHFKSTLASTTYLIVDFHATWCGPCKQIAPVFEQLAAAESKPGRLTFCKVDVDAVKEVAQNYGVSA